jgi:hypothetical protein
MAGPIKPSEVGIVQQRNIPEPVFEAFNELIAENWSISGATIRQDDVVARVMGKIEGLTRSDIFARGWLNVEEAYRREGWIVEYDKPGYNESYAATFTFSKRRK